MKTPQSFKWPFDVPTNEYINLALIGKNQLTRMEAIQFIKDTIHGNIDDIMDKTKSPLDLHQVAQPNEDGSLPQCVLVVGAPGSGKSTFACELSRKWGKGELLQQYSLVLLLRMRDRRVQEAESLKDLLYSCKEESRYSVLEEIEINRGHGFLLLFEGYDELPTGKRSENGVLERAMRGELLPDATVFITTRPCTSDYVRDQCRTRIDQHIEILGFSKANIQSYVESAMRGNQPMLENFNHYLSCYPHIHSAMYIPLQSAIIVQIYSNTWQEGGDTVIPKTMTGIYTSLARSLILRYLYDHREHTKRHPRLRSFKDLPIDVHKDLVKLSNLAYEGTMNDVVIFSDLPDEVVTLGLMQSVPELYVDEGAAVSYNYCHLTLQEYLAAYYLSLQSGEEQIQMIKTHMDSKRMSIMLRFLAGLTKFQDIPPALLHDLIAPSYRYNDHEKQVELDYLHMLFEVQDGEVIDSILEKHTINFRNDQLIPYDYYVLGYCVANSNCKWHLTMLGKNTDEEAIEMLNRGATVHNTNFNGYIGELVLQFCEFSSSGLRSLLSYHISKGMSVLWLTDNDLDSEACTVLSECIPNLTELETLELSGNPQLATGGIQQLVSSLLLHDVVKKLYLKNTGLGDCRPLAELMTSSRTLEVLKCGHNNLSSQNVELLLTGLQASTTLREFNMSQSQFSPQNTASLASLMRDNTTLQYLNISNCNIDPQGACQLAEAMSENTVLVYLPMRGNPIGECGATALAQMLQRNRTLEIMWVHDSTIGEEGTCKLINSLHNNSTLYQLRLPEVYQSTVNTTVTLDAHLESRIIWQ